MYVEAQIKVYICSLKGGQSKDHPSSPAFWLVIEDIYINLSSIIHRVGGV
jgi:hypothetical protein